MVKASVGCCYFASTEGEERKEEINLNLGNKPKSGESLY